MSESSIFRKSALERLSTPEQLDMLMQVTTPRNWYALYALCGLLACGLGWSVFGSLPTTISGKAMILPPRGVDDVYVPETGIIKEVLIKEGDVVKAGTIVMTLEQKDLEDKGRRSKRELEMKLSSLKERIRFLEKQVASKKEAVALGLIPGSDLETSTQQLNDARGELENSKNQLELGATGVREATEIRMEKDGRVVEILTSRGTLATKGDSVLTYVTEEGELNAIAFIPEIGDQAQPGMKAQISPLSVKREEFGYMLGEVNYVSDLPARMHLLKELTRNELLNQELTAGGAPYIIKITLQKDPSTFSGFKWSSSKGPKELIKAGAMCTTRIIVREQRPITLVIPALKGFLGL